MKLLITPREVVEIAFAGSYGITEERVSEGAIISAQQKFIRPVVGALYKGLGNGEYPELLNLVKAALAQYVKLLLLPHLSVSIGNIGIVQAKADHFSSAGNSNITALKNAARSEACALMHIVVEHIEDNPDIYPEYEATDNVFNRVSICSRIIL